MYQKKTPLPHKNQAFSPSTLLQGSSSPQGLNWGLRFRGRLGNQEGKIFFVWGFEAAWTWDGEEGMLPTSLRLGSRSKLVLATDKARCNASRSAGEGANARKNRDSLVEDVDVNIEGPIPLGLRLSKEDKE
jgi:hypothetical protein